MSETKNVMVVEDVSKLSVDEKFKKYSSKDPFPKILPALLNGADVIKYANQVGLLDPFCNGQMNGVIYEVKLEGKAKYWYYDDNGDVKKEDVYVAKANEMKEKALKDAGKLKVVSKLVLKPNSITYLTLEPIFRLPHYIIARFNLSVSYVYKGLLLGTGPIIDPGFIGRLSIPLHNLTNNEIELSAGEMLVAMEFTKISPNKRWGNTNVAGEDAPHKKFSEDNIEGRDVFYYTERALKGTASTHIVNDSPSQLKKMGATIIKSEKMIEQHISQSKKTVTGFTIGGIIGVIAAIFGIVFSTWLLISDMHKERNEFNAYKLQSKLDEIKIQEQIGKLEDRLISEKAANSIRIEALEVQITDLIQQLNKHEKGVGSD